MRSVLLSHIRNSSVPSTHSLVLQKWKLHPSDGSPVTTTGPYTAPNPPPPNPRPPSHNKFPQIPWLLSRRINVGIRILRSGHTPSTSRRPVIQSRNRQTVRLRLSLPVVLVNLDADHDVQTAIITASMLTE